MIAGFGCGGANEITVEVEVPVTVEVTVEVDVLVTAVPTWIPASATGMPTRATRIPSIRLTYAADPGGAKLCRLHRRRRAYIDAVIAGRNVDANTQRMNETVYEMADAVKEYGLDREVTAMELITDTGMEEWCQRRGLLPSN